MATPFLGEIRLFPFNFAPTGWAACLGQVLPISQNTALFSLLGTTYGGDGKSTFALPNLQGRVPLSQGQGVGTSMYNLGQVGGSEETVITHAELPTHNHFVRANTGPAKATGPAGAVLAQAGTPMYAPTPDGTTYMSHETISATGKSQPMSLLQPFLVLNFCIALQGIYPSRS